MISREFPPESSKIEKLENLLFVAKTCKKRQYGPIAQLGERTVRIRKVVGSIPIRSTTMPHRFGTMRLFVFVIVMLLQKSTRPVLPAGRVITSSES